MDFKEFFAQRIKRGFVRRLNNLKIAGMARQVARHAPDPSGAPVVFSRLPQALTISHGTVASSLSLMGAALERHPGCLFCLPCGHEQMRIGTNRENVHKEPPCQSCIYQSKTLYTAFPIPTPPIPDSRFPIPRFTFPIPRFIGSTFSGMKSWTRRWLAYRSRN